MPDSMHDPVQSGGGVVVSSVAARHDRARESLAALLAAGAAVLLALAFTLAVLWLILSTPKATPFDADGVRCYRAANTLSCIKTAEPVR